jgi:hypothetical protein
MPTPLTTLDDLMDGWLEERKRENAETDRLAATPGTALYAWEQRAHAERTRTEALVSATDLSATPDEDEDAEDAE